MKEGDKQMSIFQFTNTDTIVYTSYATGIIILNMDSMCDDEGNWLSFKRIVSRLHIHAKRSCITFKEIVNIPSYQPNNMVMIMMYSKRK